MALEFWVGEEGIGIGHLPGRKRPALYLRTANSFRPIAYFIDEDAANEGKAWLERIAAAKEADDE